MALSDYTTPDNIRAVLGVEDDELKDETLSLEVYEFGLRQELDLIDLDLADDYATIADLDSKTDTQRRFYEACRMFATYAVAKSLLSALPLMAPKEITDGKAATSRFAQDPYKETTKAVTSWYEIHKQRLEDAYDLLNASPVSEIQLPTMMLVGVPTNDPVTGS